jgi:protein tyrosine/serine phosphatase
VRKKIGWVLGSVCLLLALVFGPYSYILYHHSNFHEVVPGEFYRAGQMSGETLARYVKQYHIRSVLNLRGSNPREQWYQREVAATDALGIPHLDFRMSARRELPQDQARQLLTMMQQAPKPLLVHCNSGADRAGLASAIYMAGVKNAGATTAWDQLSLKYGYLPFTFSTAWPMTTGFARLGPMFGYQLARQDRTL